MNIRIVCVGKSKESYWKAAEKEYLTRIGRFSKIEVAEVADEKAPDAPNPSEIKILLKKEGERLLPALKNFDHIYALAEEGKPFSSLEFASWLKKREGENLAFVIGGSYGLAEEVKGRAEGLISLSPLTFPHRLARIVLLEQLFRAFKINGNQTYHK